MFSVEIEYLLKAVATLSAVVGIMTLMAEAGF